MGITALPGGRRMALAFVVSMALMVTLGQTAARGAPGQTLACPLGMTGAAHPAPAGGGAYTLCTGLLTSFTGTPLAPDLTLPAGAHGPPPLIRMLHCWGNSYTHF